MGDVDFCNEVYKNLTQDFLYDEDNYRAQLRIPAFVFVGVMFCIGVPSNALVLLVYRQQHVSHVMSRRFVVVVSLYDLVECLLGMSFELLDLYSDYRFNVPIACRLVNFTIAVTTCGSMTTILLWSVELFNRVARPLSRQFNSRTQITYIAVLFVVSLVVSFPVLFLFGVKTNRIGNLTGYDCGVQSEMKDSIWTLLAVCIITSLGLLVVITMLCIQFEVIKIIWFNTVKRKPSLQLIPPDALSQKPEIVVTLPEVEAVHRLSTGAMQIYTSTGMEERPPDVYNPHQFFESGSSVDICVGDSVDPKPMTSNAKTRKTSPSLRSPSSPSSNSPQTPKSQPGTPRKTVMSSPTKHYLSVTGKPSRTSQRSVSNSTFPTIKRSLSSLFSWNLITSASASFVNMRERIVPSTFRTSSLSDIGQQGLRVVVLMVLATVVFFLSIVPALVVLVLWATVRDLDDRVRCDVTYFATYNICMRSYFLSAAANPFLYSYSRPRFRHALQKFFGKEPEKMRRKTIKKTIKKGKV